MALTYKSLPFDLLLETDEQKAALEKGTFSGYLSTFDNADSYGDIIAPGAFKEDLDFFLTRGVILYQHNMREPIGKPVEAYEDERGLFLKARISHTATGKDCRTLMQDGVISKLSMGFRALGHKYLEKPDEVLKYWEGRGYTPTDEDLRMTQYGARLLTRCKLYEGSPVTFPANGECDITTVKSGDLPAGCSFEDHSERVLAAVEEWVERADAILALRAKEGRTFGLDTLRRLSAVRDRLVRMTAEPRIDAPVDPAELRALMAAFYAIDTPPIVTPQ